MALQQTALMGEQFIRVTAAAEEAGLSVQGCVAPAGGEGLEQMPPG